MSKLKVLVVGASVAGPTAAYWLAKAGATVTVIERFPKLRTGGQNIDIRTAGVTVMRRTPGMEAAVRAKTTRMDGMSWVDTTGQRYGTIRPTGNPDQQSLISEYEIFRGDLAQILYDMTSDNENINYHFGEQVVSIQQNNGTDNGPITVEFANGLPSTQYDLVVACDGATSRTRAIGLNCGIRDYIHPTNSWAAYFSIPQDLLQGSTIAQGYSAPGGRFMGIGPDPSSATINRVGLLSFPRSTNTSTDSASFSSFRTAVQQNDNTTLKQYVANHYRNAGWITDSVLTHMLSSSDFYASEIVQVKVPSIYKGRFVLVGDAGYAPGPTGGGTTLALAGAYVLAGEIAKHKGDIDAGLAGYEKAMRPIITDLHKIPPGVSTIMAPQTEWGIWIRNNIFWLITSSGIIEFAQKYLGGAFASSEKHKLEEYEWLR